MNWKRRHLRKLEEKSQRQREKGKRAYHSHGDEESGKERHPETNNPPTSWRATAREAEWFIVEMISRKRGGLVDDSHRETLRLLHRRREVNKLNRIADWFIRRGEINRRFRFGRERDRDEREAEKPRYDACPLSVVSSSA